MVPAFLGTAAGVRQKSTFTQTYERPWLVRLLGDAQRPDHRLRMDVAPE